MVVAVAVKGCQWDARIVVEALACAIPMPPVAVLLLNIPGKHPLALVVWTQPTFILVDFTDNV